MTRRIARPIALVFGLLAAGASVALTACDDGIQPLIWPNVPDTVELYSLARTEYIDRPGAYTMLYQGPGTRQPIIPERLLGDPFAFDFAVSENEAGDFLLLPTGVFAESNAQAGILVDSTATFEGLERAPRDRYITDEPVVATTDVIYVIRSRQHPRSRCFYYGKMEILELDPAGIMTLRILANINCSDRSLVPNAPVEEEEDGEGAGGG
ncbi:MAG: hypothetical protein KY466_06450 [Gemmatimonadetes bacterium]|nr:hypothetical protein [Gemmatimonadota bacterium]